jgi:hypothetical protein
MSKKKNRGPRGLKVQESLAPDVVKMRFTEHKYYNDLDKPIFEAGKIYELSGADWIQRWLRRGGEIVEGQLSFPIPDEPNPSTIVPQNSKLESDKGEESEDGETTDQGKASGDDSDAIEDTEQEAE